jgi:predicted RNase H-like HicB family nuclease
MHRFLIILEKANGNYSAYSPDLAGCIATGATREEAEKNMHEAIKCIFVGYWRTNCQSLNLILLQNMLLFSKGIFGYFRWQGRESIRED